MNHVPEAFLARAALRDRRIGHRVGPYLLVERKKHFDAPVVYRVLQIPAMLEGELVLVDHERAPETHTSLLRQATAMAKIHHPHVLRLVAFGEDHHGSWLVSDLPGTPATLAELLADDFHGLPAAAVRVLIEPLAAALEGLAAAHLVHGQIRPEHVYVHDLPGAPGHVVLGGFVRVPARDQQAPPASAREHVYQAPELIGTHTVGPTTDAYAVAAITFELLAGRPPFRLDAGPGASPIKKTERGPELEGLDWPIATLDFFRRALAWAPSRRPPDATSFRAALAEALDALEGTASLDPPAGDETPLVLFEEDAAAAPPRDDDALDPWRWTDKNKRLGAPPAPAPGPAHPADDATAPHDDDEARPRRASGTQVMSVGEVEDAEHDARSIPRMHDGRRPAHPEPARR